MRKKLDDVRKKGYNIAERNKSELEIINNLNLKNKTRAVHPKTNAVYV